MIKATQYVHCSTKLSQKPYFFLSQFHSHRPANLFQKHIVMQS